MVPLALDCFSLRHGVNFRACWRHLGNMGISIRMQLTERERFQHLLDDYAMLQQEYEQLLKNYQDLQKRK